MMCYYVTLRPGSHKTYSTPFDSFWCCVGTGIENHAKYGKHIYSHDDAGLWVNLFIASELRWKERGLVLRQETRYPDADTTTLTLACEKPVKLALRVRKPAWADSLQIKVNGEARQAVPGPSGFVELPGTWKTGDRIEVRMPMRLRLEAMPDNPNRVAMLYGPLVLAGDLGPVAAAASKAVPVLVTWASPET
jgi:DUF1680 family protein